jgi:hypothetical protein
VQPRPSGECFRDGRRAKHIRFCTHLHGHVIGSQHDFWIEQREKRVELTVVRGREERGHDFPLTRAICGRRHLSPLDPATRPAGKLTCRRWRAAHDRCDLIERHGEHVVQHEHEPLGGIEGVEDDQECRTDRVGQ